MELNTRPVWSLSLNGAAPTSSKKDSLEAIIALAYLGIFLTQRETPRYLYQPFLSRYTFILRNRREQAASWFVNDLPVCGALERLGEEATPGDIKRLLDACRKEGCAPWAIDLLIWIDLVTFPDRGVGTVVFYGITPDGDIFPTEYALPLGSRAPYPDTRIPVIKTPFWSLVWTVACAANDKMKKEALCRVIFQNVFIPTEPLSRLTGDTLITALYQDLILPHLGEEYPIFDMFRNDTALASQYRTDTADLTGLTWICQALDRDSYDVLSSLKRAFDSLQSAYQDSFDASNSNLSMESLSLGYLTMADDTTSEDQNDDTSDSTTTETQTTDPSGDTSTTTSTTDTDPATSTTDDAPAQSPSDQPASPASDTASSSGDTTSPSSTPDTTQPSSTPDQTSEAPADGEPPTEENTIDGLSFDTSGETPKDTFYRRGVLALMTKIDDDMDFPVSDEVRSLLKSFVKLMLFSVSITDVKDYMKKLGLQPYLEAVSF